jgi:UDP-glucose 4-epimerase
MAELQVPRVVAVTGASGYIGERLVERLLSEEGVQQVLGIDLRPSALKHDKLISIEQDITATLDTLFRDQRVEAVVHLAFVLRQLRDRAESRRINVGGASNVLWACEEAGVRRIVLLSSSTVYGANPDNQELLTEEAELNPSAAFTYAADKALTESYFRRYRDQHVETDVSILRSCVVMGPSAQNFITGALDKPVLIGIGRADPPMQFLHEDDLIDLLWRFVSESRPGVFNVAGAGTVRWSELVRAARKRLIPLPAPLAYGLTAVAWHLRLQSDAPSAGLDFIRWPWTVGTAKVEAELGYRFQHSSRDALQAYLGDPLRTAGGDADQGGE